MDGPFGGSADATTSPAASAGETGLPLLVMQCAALPGHTLIAIGLDAVETLDAPFAATLAFTAGGARIDPRSVLGRPMTVTVRSRTEGIERPFHGLVSRLRLTGCTGGVYAYEAELVPPLQFMTQTEDCRFFERRTTRDILSTLLAAAGQAVEFRIGAAEARPYTVQFGETDFHFVSRLMQDDGLFYFFRHEPGGCTMVVADANVAFPQVAEAAFQFSPGFEAPDRFAAWATEGETAVGATTLADYDYTGVDKPSPATERTVLPTAGASQRAVYRWPGLRFESAALDGRARVMQEAAEAPAARAAGEGRHPGFSAGGRFLLARDPLAGDAETRWVVREVTHHATSTTRTTSGAVSTYSNTFSAFPADTPWRPRQTLRAPRMSGIYSAVVIGPPGEEIYTDDLARVKVRFPWSHLDDTTPEGALWVRVVQPWAGNGWGVQMLPRVGTEVAVAFVDGEPDRPVIVGGLYNAAMAPIYPPGSKTRSGVRTRSSPGGGAAQFNELTFEDRTGEELVFLHAQKDHRVEVENDQSVLVQKDRALTVDGKEAVEVALTQSIEVGQSRSLQVGQSQTTTIGQSWSTAVGTSRTTTVGTSQTTTVGTGRTATVTQGDDMLTVAAGNLVIEVSGGDVSITAATGSISLAAPCGSISLTATQEIAFAVGGSTITMTPAEIKTATTNSTTEAVMHETRAVLIMQDAVIFSVAAVYASVHAVLCTLLNVVNMFTSAVATLEGVYTKIKGSLVKIN